MKQNPKILENTDISKEILSMGLKKGVIEIEIHVPKKILANCKKNGPFGKGEVESLPEKLFAKIPTFIPARFRKVDNELISAIESSSPGVISWVKEQFPATPFPPVSVENAVFEALFTFILGSPVDQSLESVMAHEDREFLARFLSLGFLADNAMDTDGSEEKGSWINEGSLEKFNNILDKAVNYFEKNENDEDDNSFESVEEIFQMEFLHENPTRAAFVGVLWDLASSVRKDQLREGNVRKKANFIRRYIPFVFELQNHPKEFKAEVYRHLRSKASGAVEMTHFRWDFENFAAVPKFLVENPYYPILCSFGSKLMAASNDVLGFEKDLIALDFKGNMIMHSLWNGHSLQEAWDSEIAFLVETMETYLEIRDKFLAFFSPSNCSDSWEDMGKIAEKYVGIWDTIIFGHIIQPMYCKRAGAGAQNKMKIIGWPN